MLHTNFQQNKDCNARSTTGQSRTAQVAYGLPAKQGLQRVLQPIPPRLRHGVAYELPAKQGLQHVLSVGNYISRRVAYELPAKQGLQSDSNKVKRTLISELHTTLPQNRALRPGISDSKSGPATWMLHLNPPAEQPALDYAEELRDRLTGGLSRLSRGGRRDCGCHPQFPGRTGHTMD